MGAHLPLQFSDIAEAINASSSGYLSANSIATRLSRGIGLVNRAIAQLMALKVVRREYDNGVPVYEIIAPVPEGSVEGRAPVERTALQETSKEIIAGEGDTDDDDEVSLEAIAAARLWKERLGDNRWRDDPRALREASRREYLQPPFAGGA